MQDEEKSKGRKAEAADQLPARLSHLFEGLDGEIYHAVFDCTNDAYFIVEPETGAILDANKSAADGLGYSKEELFRMTVWDIASPEAAVHLPEIMNSLKTEGKARFEHIHQRKDGGDIPVEVSAISMDIGNHKIYMGTVRDISKRKQFENQIQEHVAELERFKKLAVGRELRMIELKREVNELLKKLGCEEKYHLNNDG